MIWSIFSVVVSWMAAVATLASIVDQEVDRKMSNDVLQLLLAGRCPVRSNSKTSTAMPKVLTRLLASSLV